MSRPPRRKAYPSDVSEGEWEFVAPYLSLMTEDAPQRVHDLRELFHALRYVMRTGCPWRYLPNDFRVPSGCWEAVYPQTGYPRSRGWLDEGRLFRGYRSRPARNGAPSTGQKRPTLGGHFRWANDAVDAGKWRQSGLGWT